MKPFKRIAVTALGVIMMFGLFGCGKQKYNLILDDASFETKKTSYAAGDTVTVYYDLIATDTDYHFYSDSEDVELKPVHDDKHAFTYQFIMPAHDVTLYCSTKESMIYEPEE